MNRLTLATIALCLLALSPAALRAQVPVATPTPNPLAYNDPAMSYTAPSDARLLASRVLPVAALGEDLQTVAAWGLDIGKPSMHVIQLEMEAYSGAPDQWEEQFESQMHSAQDGVLIRDRTPITLKNGMPAYFVQIAYGSGFSSRKEFAVVWADGQRGVVLAEIARIGDVSKKAAESALENATAVRYPVNQP